jgi:hypothetical protein
VIKYWVIYFPGLIHAIGYRSAGEQFMSSPPYILALIGTLCGGYSATKHKDHGFHVIIFLIIAISGFVLMTVVVEVDRIAMYVGACVACTGAYPAFILIMAWLACTMNGYTKRAFAIGLTVGMGQIAGIILPHILHLNSAATIRKGHIICISSILVTILLTLVLRKISMPRDIKPIDVTENVSENQMLQY